MSVDFDWPCEKRTAHGPHDTPSDLLSEFCPGVRAHPETQIGKPPGTPEPDLLDRINEFDWQYRWRMILAYPVIAQTDGHALTDHEAEQAFRRILMARNLRRTHELYLESRS